MSSRATQQYDIPERSDHYAIFDASYLDDIPHYVQQWQSSRIVLVTSKTLYKQTEHVQKLESKLGSKITAKKIGVGAHTPYADVIEITHLLQEHNADCLICIGSSSYSDACKTAVYLQSTMAPGFGASNMESTIDQTKGAGVLKPATAKLIVVPTSLSASEWNGTASCTNLQGKKQHFGLGSHLRGGPELIIMDPDLASTAPRTLWLSSGVRCIDHCVETVCDRTVSEEAVTDALDGLACMIKGLAEYKEGEGGREKGELLRGISECQKGSRQAIKGLLVHKSTFGPSHAIGHQLGSVAGVMHGVTSCILLAPVLRYTKKKTESQQARILECFNKTLEWQESDAADALTRFVKMLGLPTTLSGVDVTDEATIERVAEKTLTDVWGGGKPQLTTREEVMEILNMVR